MEKKVIKHKKPPNMWKCDFVDHKKCFGRFGKSVWQGYKPDIPAPVYAQRNRNVYAG